MPRAQLSSTALAQPVAAPTLTGGRPQHQFIEGGGLQRGARESVDNFGDVDNLLTTVGRSAGSGAAVPGRLGQTGFMGYDWVSFTTDYGLDDGFVAACAGVIARIAPSARVLNVTHTVAAQDIRRGAAVLAQTAPYLPVSVHLAVVDPGVGTERRPIVIVAATGLLVGPDNGLLIPAAEALGGVRTAYLLQAAEYRLSTVSETFHGRDVFAPAAAHLAAGVGPDEFGPSIDTATLVRLPEPKTVAEKGKLTTEVLGIDSFGNIQLAATGADLDVTGAQSSRTILAHLGGRSVSATLGRTFADVTHGAIVLYVDSAGRLALAVNGGSAADAFGRDLGSQVVLLFADR